MPLETGTYISDLVASNPASGDQSGQGDDHLRLIKAALLATFPHLTGAMTLDQGTLNGIPAAITNANAYTDQRSNGAYGRAISEAKAYTDSSVASGVAGEAAARHAEVVSESNTRHDQVTALQSTIDSISNGLSQEANTRYSTDTTLLANFGNYMALGSVTSHSAGNGKYYFDIPMGSAGTMRIAAGSGTCPTGNGDSVYFGPPFSGVVALLATSTSPSNNVSVQVLDGNAFRAWAFTEQGNYSPGTNFYFLVIGTV